MAEEAESCTDSSLLMAAIASPTAAGEGDCDDDIAGDVAEKDFIQPMDLRQEQRRLHRRWTFIMIAGVLWLSPDSLLINLVHTDCFTMLFWRSLISGLCMIPATFIVMGTSNPLLSTDTLLINVTLLIHCSPLTLPVTLFLSMPFS